MTPPPDPELQAMADEEVERACTLSWRALRDVTPWGDTHEAFAPSGRAVQVERSYLWADAAGGDILVEAMVFLNLVLHDQGARAARMIEKPR